MISLFLLLLLLLPPPVFTHQRLEETCLLFCPLISTGFSAHSSRCLFCPSEADALNKMTTVICFCHSGPSTDWRRGSKLQCRRRRPNVCRLPLIPFFFFFFSIFQRAAFSIKPEVAGLFKTSRDPTPHSHGAPSLGEIRN